MFEPGTGEALEIASSLQTFHDDELIEFGDAALAIDFHQRWLASGGTEPDYAQCVGYRKPLFLGGADEIENLELSDLDVYWHLMGQLIVKTKSVPQGAPVRINIT
ncbi:T6SS immunity protein Tdi1 domain-containing protein [Bradyrhizobium sp. JYMT SZCCT0180]|uniref:T6SS immunity protein Tdi1 domain-containing protein n=1 Tax=Bradyrhizobium sp. JYMT SZCCT0180 TaxID=2807666 RepID=UPI002013904B|nr:T6SS immunity protein Tdi1 domain-containing protein [Bradyrhizobium sp. JYMT SZCCT0180]